LLHSRISAIALCAAVVLLTIVAYGGPLWPVALSLLVTDGALAAVWIFSAGLLGSVVLRVAGIGSDPLKAVTAAALGLGLYSLAALGLGLAGLLNQFTTIAMPLLSAALWLAGFYRDHGNASLQPQVQSLERWLRAPAGWAWLWLAAMPLLGMMLVAAMVPPGVLWPGDPHPYDVVEYHLQVPRQWYELGHIVPLQHNVFSFFPFNAEMQFLLAMHLRGGPWAGMFLSQFLAAGYAVLMVVAVAAAAPAGKARAVAGLAAAVVPWTVLLGSVAYNESALMLYGALAVAWTMRAIAAMKVSDKPRPAMVMALLAGAMAGLACGTKLTAVPVLLLAVPLVLLLQHRSAKALAIAAAFILAGVVTWAPWLVRNQAWAGNCVFPEAQRPLGRAHFTPQQTQRWHEAHRPPPHQNALTKRLSAAGQQILLDWRFGYILWPLLLAGIWLGRRQPQIGLPALVILLLLVFWLTFTHLQSRFFVLAIPLTGLVLGRVTWPKPALAGALALLCLGIIVAILGLPGVPGERGQGIHARLMRGVEPLPGVPIVGLSDLRLFLPPQVQDALSKLGPDQRVCLVGDATAFRYPLGSGQLSYRTVFDVDVKSGQDLVSAWSGGCDTSALRVIYLSELRRFHRTYRSIPAPEATPPGAVVVP
jgi:hypothetical protein